MKNTTKRMICLLLIMSLWSTSIQPASAASKAKLKSYSAAAVQGGTCMKSGDTYYIVKGKSANISISNVTFTKTVASKYAKTTKSWKSSSTSILTVKSGKVTAKKSGSAKVTVKVASKNTKKTAKKTISKTLKFKVVSASDFSKKFHTHSYSAATCTSAAKCSCGATSGSALGHSWNLSGSQYVCSRCGATKAASGTTPDTPTTPDKTKQEILDEMTTADGVLTLTEQFLKDNGYIVNPYSGFNDYHIPNEFTKAKTVILPKLSNNGEFWDDNLREDVTYVVPDGNVFYYNKYNMAYSKSTNELIVMTKGDYFVSTEMYSTRNPNFLGHENGAAKLTLKEKYTETTKTFTFSVVPDKNKVTDYSYKLYQEKKRISAEAIKDCNTTAEKVRKLMLLAYSGQVGNLKTYNYDCGIMAWLFAEYCNLNGIPCCSRSASYDVNYGQTKTHVNNMAIIDGVPYVIDVMGSMWEYSDYYNLDGTGKDYTNVKGMSMKGVLDDNISSGNNPVQCEMLKNAGYNVEINCDLWNYTN